MEYTPLHYRIGLSFLYGIGPRKANLLFSKAGGAEAVFRESISFLHHQTGISASVLSQMNRQKALNNADEQLNFIVKNNIQTHFYHDNNYPRRLRQCCDAPIILYSIGNFNPNPEKTVAIVGTRSATAYGKSLCEELVTKLSEIKIQVVSGMAYGIDICAHKACVDKNIETVGVLGHGLDRIYPNAHRKIAEKMLECGGLLTEFVPGTNPDRENFPMRNRIVAGMADSVIVIESKRSGGSLITVDLANDYNRDVFAFPGNIGVSTSEGCNLLIKQNKAHLVLSGDDFIQQMAWDIKSSITEVSPKIIPDELSTDEKSIVTYLSETESEHIDILSMKLKMAISKINVELFNLEMKNIVRSLPGKRYSLK